jgi:hypothetical protein
VGFREVFGKVRRPVGLVLWFLAWIEEEILGNVVGCLDWGLELGVSGECTGFGMRPWFYNPKLVS